MRRRNMLGKGGITYVFSAQTTSTSVTACITSVTVNIVSTANGENTPYTVYTYGGSVTGGTTGDTSITIKLTKNAGTSQQSGSITLKQTGSNKTKTIYIYQSGGSGYTFTTTASTNITVHANKSYVTFNYTSRDSCGLVRPSYTKSGAMITSVTCYNSSCNIYYSANSDTANTRTGTVTLTQKGSGTQIIINVTQEADRVSSISYNRQYNMAMNYTNVTSIKPYETCLQPQSGETTWFCAGCARIAFAIYGSGTYVNGSNITTTATTNYYSGKKETNVTTNNYSGQTSNGMSILEIPSSDYRPSCTNKSYSIGNLNNVLLTVNPSSSPYTYNNTLTYNGVTATFSIWETCD